MTPIVEFRGVSYRINGHHILRNLSFSLAAGETLVLLGRSGSGKTTALKMVNGLLFPTEGEVCVEGMPTTSWDPIRLKRRIGYVIQEAGLFPHFTVADNVGLVPKLEGWPPSRVRARTGELLEQVTLPPSEFSLRYPRELSSGQRQRVDAVEAAAADRSEQQDDESGAPPHRRLLPCGNGMFSIGLSNFMHCSGEPPTES